MYSFFKNNIWGVDLADMQLVTNATKELDICYVLLIFSENMLLLFL